jgi:hypothetical protein
MGRIICLEISVTGCYQSTVCNSHEERRFIPILSVTLNIGLGQEFRTSHIVQTRENGFSEKYVHCKTHCPWLYYLIFYISSDLDKIRYWGFVCSAVKRVWFLWILVSFKGVLYETTSVKFGLTLYALIPYGKNSVREILKHFNLSCVRYV